MGRLTEETRGLWGDKAKDPEIIHLNSDWLRQSHRITVKTVSQTVKIFTVGAHALNLLAKQFSLLDISRRALGASLCVTLLSLYIAKLLSLSLMWFRLIHSRSADLERFAMSRLSSDIFLILSSRGCRPPLTSFEAADLLLFRGTVEYKSGKV